FQNRIPNFAGALTHDGAHLVFGSNREGSLQLYAGEVAQPSAAPRRITPGTERVQTAALTRDGKGILFTRDRGADENSHIFRIALDGSGLVDLTPGEGVRSDPPALPLRRTDLMIFGRRSVKSPASTLVAQDLSGGAGRDFYKDPAPTFVADASPDGSRALAVRVISVSEFVLLEIDVASGAAKRLWPAEGKKEALGTAAYSADGATVYLTTDQGGETSALLALDPASGNVKARWTPDPSTAIIDALIPSPRGDVLAVHVDAGNRHLIRLLEAGSLRERATSGIPDGNSALGEFTPDGRTMTFALSTPDSPGEPYALDVQTGKVAVLRADARPGLSSLTKVEVTVASVPAFDGKPIPVHTYLPKGHGGQKLPVMVEFHGGPAASSSIGWKPRAQFFASLGYAWVEPNVRGSTGFGRAWEMADNREKRGDVLEDMASVNAWVKQQPWADPSRVVIFGGSYGGWVVLMGLTRQQPLWSVGIDLVGVADLRTLLRSTDQLIRAIFVDEFGDPDKDEALLAAWSPLPDAGKITAPLFVYQGQNDPRVPRAESDAIVSALRSRGRPVEYMVAPDEGHSLDRRENQLEFYARSARFLEEHLGR
ncbi:MAG TPA: prolyl oligopeptidase family serine peptidase, partial [Myxococcales bacterium]|nr:prolyl oligopeptidase family serine peptidase [Myxococcales bacterium]